MLLIQGFLFGRPRAFASPRYCRGAPLLCNSNNNHPPPFQPQQRQRWRPRVRSQILLSNPLPYRLSVSSMMASQHRESSSSSEENHHHEIDSGNKQDARSVDKETNNNDDVWSLKKLYNWTVCMVPPESATDVWDTLTRARTQLRDPGLYRWPPHANLLYPFVDCLQIHSSSTDEKKKNSNKANKDSDDTHHLLPTVNGDMIDRLEQACQDCEPFEVQLKQFGTFGGAKRGVLWLHPKSHRHGTMEEDPNPDAHDVSPLVALQACLEAAFPQCTEQRTVSGQFTPHMTLSHFVDRNAALLAQTEIESWWPSRGLWFPVKSIFVLHRQGDAGQFEIVAEVPLGQTTTRKDGETTGGRRSILHVPSRPFRHMPETELDWVREERMKLKERRRSGGRRGRRRSREPRVPDPPEVIAAKRAARKAKREAEAFSDKDSIN